MPIFKQIDAWTLRDKEKLPICITTNGFVKKDGCCVMGRGIALEVKNRYPGIDKVLGDIIKENGNICQIIPIKRGIIAFPVKVSSRRFKSKDSLLSNVVSHAREKYKVGDLVPGFHLKAEPDIIKKSCQQLMKIIEEKKIKKVILPFPGIGAGQLNPDKVKPILEEYLDDRVIIVYK